MNRRNFLKTLSFTAVTPLLVKQITFGQSLKKNLSFGIITDVHKDLMPDADSRLESFIEEATKRKVDFIIQLGDFCFADEENDDFLTIWNSFNGEKYHVLGNHDMDKNTKKEIMDYWQMPDPYYSFDQNGIHFIVLDANYINQNDQFTDYANANFYIDDSLRTFINPAQIEWFKADLNATKLPTIVFSHQSLWHHEWGVKNRLALQQVMEAKADEIICCMNGHNHIDYHCSLNGIDYIDINSASYQWVGDEYASKERFDKELYHMFPNLPHIAGYTKPLYAFAQIDTKGKFTLEGKSAKWMPPSPFELGKVQSQESSQSSTRISDRKLKF